MSKRGTPDISDYQNKNYEIAPRSHIGDTVREGMRALEQGTHTRMIAGALAAVAAFQAFDAGSARAAVSFHVDKKTGCIDVLHTPAGAREPDAQLSYDSLARFDTVKVPATFEPSVLYTQISKTDITVPGANEHIQDPGMMRSIVSLGIERAKQKYKLPFKTFSEMTLSEAILIASDIVESSYTYDTRIVSGDDHYDPTREKRVDSMPSDVRLAQGQNGIEMGVVCRHYAVDFENVLETIRDMTGVPWASRVHVDSICSPQQRHAWSVIFEDTPNGVLMGTGDITFSDSRQSRGPKEVGARFSWSPKSVFEELSDRDAKDADHQSLLETYRSYLEKSFTSGEQVEFLIASLDIGEHLQYTRNYSTELMRTAADHLYERNNSHNRSTASKTIQFTERIFTALATAVSRFKGSAHIQHDIEDFDGAARSFLTAINSRDDLSAEQKIALFKKSIRFTPEGYLRTADALEKLGKTREADEWYQQAIEKFRRPASYAKAVAFYRKQRNAAMAHDVLKKFDYSLYASSYYDNPLNAYEGHSMRGEIAREDGDLSSALVAFGSAYRAAKGYPDLVVRSGVEYAKVLISLERFDEARDVTHQIVKTVTATREEMPYWTPGLMVDDDDPHVLESESSLFASIQRQAKKLSKKERI